MYAKRLRSIKLFWKEAHCIFLLEMLIISSYHYNSSYPHSSVYVAIYISTCIASCSSTAYDWEQDKWEQDKKPGLGTDEDESLAGATAE